MIVLSVRKISNKCTMIISYLHILLLIVPAVPAVDLELFELPSHTYPDALCNDGSRAGYFHDTDLTKLDKIHVHLNGGNLCDDDEACVERCDQDHDGVVDNHLCTAATKQTQHRNNGLFSSDQENPLHDFWHVIVPYCSSDTWAGTGYSAESGYYFHGKHIFRNVMNSLAHHFNLFEAKEFVLSGMSAGAYGVGLNCDDVSDWLHANNPDMKVRCVADSPDFIPWWVHSPDCPRRSDGYQKSVNMFWSRDMDHSCQHFVFNPAHNVTEPEEVCGILSRSLSFITTDIFILVSLRDSTISVGYGCPQPGLEDEIFLPWMAGMHDLVTTAAQHNPQVGLFVPSCPCHVIYGGRYQDVIVTDIHTGLEMNAYSALKHWLDGDVVHAVDTLTEENLTCP